MCIFRKKTPCNNCGECATGFIGGCCASMMDNHFEQITKKKAKKIIKQKIDWLLKHSSLLDTYYFPIQRKFDQDTIRQLYEKYPDIERIVPSFSRVSGDCICSVCGQKYYDHHQYPGVTWLNILCDGRVIKL